MIFEKMYTTVDTHTAGEPLRIITDGIPEIKGETQLEKRAYCMEHLDDLRQVLMYEPRGHDGMYGCIITEPSTPGADFGVLFMHNEGWSTMCGHGVIGVVTMAIETGRVKVEGNHHTFIVDCPCGPVTAYATTENHVVKSVAFENVPSFVYMKDFPIEFDNYQFNVDISYGGAFYAVVHTKDLGVHVSKKELDDLKDLGDKIKHYIEARVEVKHPEEDIDGIYGVIFSGDPHSNQADLRNVTIFADKQIDRSPCGSGTAARVATLYEREKLKIGDQFIHEAITDEHFIGEVQSLSKVDKYQAVIPKVTGSAYITGFHQFVINPYDALHKGFLLK
ncbi:proline racemase family protein [Oceanobacillus jeddahense]|uniref:proline racemase family protein n=1 Tax=Oceanobacillus jeddahense TaxID=1462527 RepID=UPI000595D60F|nr:proline racemase family protein [Oceanobacillus jeddahense]